MKTFDKISKQIVKIIIPIFNDNEIIKFDFEITFTPSGNYSSLGTVYKRMSQVNEFIPDEVKKLIKNNYNSLIDDFEKRFNKVAFEIYADGKYHANYYWDEEEIKKQKAQWAFVLPQWINDRMISLLFSAGYGDEKSWQKGIFIFKVQSQQLTFNGIIYDKETPTTVTIKLPDYLIEGILEHHDITNNGLLSDTWKKWNKMIIHCPHNDLDLDKDVEYRLEDTN